MTLSISTESLVGILIGIALNLYINNQLTHNSLPITENYKIKGGGPCFMIAHHQFNG